MVNFTQKQRDYIDNSNKRWNVKVGATGTGKTFVDLVFTIPYRTRQFRDNAGLYLLVGITFGTIERNILAPMREFYGEELVGNIVKNNGTVRLFGETYYVIGAEKENSINKIQGSTVKYCYGDEFVDWNESFFKMLTTRLRTEGATADLTGNPNHPNHWAKKFIDEQLEENNLFYQVSTIYDNPTLPEDFVKAQISELGGVGTTSYKRYFLGQWARAEGTIYQLFANYTDKYLIDYDNALLQNIELITIGVDFGGNKSSTAFVGVGFANGFRDVIVLDSEKIDGKVDSDTIKEKFIDFADSFTKRYSNSALVFCDSAEQVLIMTLKNGAGEKGLDVDVRNAKKGSIIERIKLVNKLVGQGRFWVLRHNTQVIEALKNAVWNEKKHKDERLDDGSSDIDTLDAMEYALESSAKYLINYIM